MFLRIADRLFGALLTEISSGQYAEGGRFMSHRRIMRQWRVAADTANSALFRLTEEGILVVRERSGHYLANRFRERALLALHRTESPNTDFSPLRQHTLRMKMLLQGRTGYRMKRVAAVLILRGDHQPNQGMNDPSLARCIASSLTARGIFLEAEQRRVAVDFFLCNGTPDSERHTLSRVLNSRPDGVMIINRKPPFQSKLLGESLLLRGIPVVALYDESGGSDMVSVNFNNVGIGFTAAEIFLDKGHRKLAILSYRQINTNYFSDRIRGFLLRANRERCSTVVELHVDNQHPEEFSQAAAVLRQEGVTALFAVTEDLLAGLLPPLTQERLRVPKDVSVLMSASASTVQNFAAPVDTLIQDFVLLGRMGLRALERYCKGDVTQKTYFLDPALEVHGSITDLAERA